MGGEPGFLAELLGRIAYEFSLMSPMLPTYLHLILSALFPIYAGSHASLSRPSSAAAPDKKSAKHGSNSDEDEDEDSDDEEDVQKMEGLSPSDAIMFPLFAGCTLAGLYFLLKWLEDPAILNKFLNAYFALFSTFAVFRIVADALDVSSSFIFPRRYADEGVMWHVHEKDRKTTAVTATGIAIARRKSPLPGSFSRLPLPSSIVSALWTIRALPHQKWTIKLYLHKVGALKVRVGTHEVVGAFTGLSSVLWYNFVAKPWFLTNLMGFGFSYNALQLLSPTTFGTGSLILGALFFYDIYFVFFTPMMITVAKSLDVPIKLVFPRPDPKDPTGVSEAMLGLGDVVLPGIMIGLALRFDLFMFYKRKQRTIQASVDPVSTEIVKAKYTPASNRWGEHFWTHSWFGSSLVKPQTHTQHPPTTFPKPYFRAAVTGYIIGMMTTTVVMHIFQHGQPALLYLVPGVLISIWGTALARGEIQDVWNFSEAVDEEEDSKTDNTKAKHASQSFFSLEKQKRNGEILEHRILGRLSSERTMENDQGSGAERSRPKTADSAAASTKAESAEQTTKVKRVLTHDYSHEFFSFSIEAPFKLKRPDNSSSATKVIVEQPPNDAKKSEMTVDTEGLPKEKRRRVD